LLIVIIITSVEQIDKMQSYNTIKFGLEIVLEEHTVYIVSAISPVDRK